MLTTVSVACGEGEKELIPPPKLVGESAGPGAWGHNHSEWSVSLVPHTLLPQWMKERSLERAGEDGYGVCGTAVSSDLRQQK